MRKKQILEYTRKKLQTNILPETFIFFLTYKRIYWVSGKYIQNNQL